MGRPWEYCCWVPPLLALLLFFSFPSIHAYIYVDRDMPNTANLSSSWTIGDQEHQPILRKESKNGTAFLCEFYCQNEKNECFFAVVILGLYAEAGTYPQVVWTANRSKPVRSNATLELSEEGDLILADADGTQIWSTNTGGKSIAGLNLTETGNLVLFDTNKAPVWQSFDHPTDSLVLGQKLLFGKKLTASTLASNWDEGLISLAVTDEGLVAYVEANPPQIYFTETVKGIKSNPEPSYVQFRDGSLALFIHNADPNHPDSGISIPAALSAQFMKLEPDGHLRVYEWREYEWSEVADLLTGYQGDCEYPLITCGPRSDCEYPTVCGKYGICTGERQCSCPASSDNRTIYFSQIKERQANLGCSEIKPISCMSSQYHSFLELENIYYSTFRLDLDTDLENCKQACLRNCSCKAALFRYASNISLSGGCFLISEVFSLISNSDQSLGFNFTMFLKVEKSPIENKPNRTWKKATTLGIILGSSLGVLFLIGTCFLLFRVKKDSIGVEEDDLDQLPGMSTRFSYEDLRSTTKNFNHKLGEGGFGSVFEGVLSSGIKVAVKRLEGFGQVKKSFLAEVETIGGIHHVNLVRLVGFCAEKSHRLLVYEYMCNGSLDKWIFHRNQDLALGWQSRRKIILDIAKGLAYLHEECRQKIFHLDIKPQNILLDENFNAKVSDFGLSKLIDRDQSQVVTTMKGTPGYLAPEWLSSVITEKVDVYSFGVVLLEILCGRRNIDRSQPEEDMHLLTTFKRKAEEEQLVDMIDKAGVDMQLHGAEVLEMMRLATWCLQNDFAKRPSMSTVVKVLEGSVGIEGNLDYNFSYPPPPGNSLALEVAASTTTPLVPSALSGPR